MRASCRTRACLHRMHKAWVAQLNRASQCLKVKSSTVQVSFHPTLLWTSWSPSAIREYACGNLASWQHLATRCSAWHRLMSARGLAVEPARLRPTEPHTLGDPKNGSLEAPHIVWLLPVSWPVRCSACSLQSNSCCVDWVSSQSREYLGEV